MHVDERHPRGLCTSQTSFIDICYGIAVAQPRHNIHGLLTYSNRSSIRNRLAMERLFIHSRFAIDRSWPIDFQERFIVGRLMLT